MGGRKGIVIVLSAAVITTFYLLTLWTPFDFIDDGNLVYPAPSGTTNYVSLWWGKVVANYEHLGPFRPTLWIHWELFANLFQGNALYWRIERLLWCGLSTSMLLWFFSALKISRSAAFIATAAAMWNPYRNEVWTSLTLAEGVAMPYAIFALLAARKGATSPRAWRWDIAALFGLIMALGCKNTFVALIPAMVVLRVWPDDRPFRESIRANGWRALLLATPVALVLAHLVYFKMHWHEGQYVTHPVSLTQFMEYAKCLKGAMSFDFMIAGIVVVALISFIPNRPAFRLTPALAAAFLLVAAGIVVYMPMNMISGRYSMPAVWGLDLLFALLLTRFETRPTNMFTLIGWVVLIACLNVTGIANLGRQEKFAARAKLMNETLEQIMSTAPKNATIAWISGDSLADELDREEGIHFYWHLHARGRTDLNVVLIDNDGKTIRRVELPTTNAKPTIRIGSNPIIQAGWSAPEQVEVKYWFGNKSFTCFTSAQLE